MENKCISCNGKLKNKTVEYKVYGINIGKFPALVCDSCGEQWFSEETSRRIEEKEKELGLFGLSVESKVSYSGNSLIIRIPKELAKFLNINKESKVQLVPENKSKLCIAVK
jgi:YgiT-type zinc finger domain-containing protein